MYNYILVLILLLFNISKVISQQLPDFLSKHNPIWVENAFNQMTLDEKIGQLLMPRANYSGKPYEPAILAEWVEKYKIGGLVFFAGKPSEQAKLTNALQALSKVPLLIGEDFEWGLAMRMDSTDRFPYQMTLGAMDASDDLIEEMGAEIGRQCKKLGVHINYAPVVDINNNPNNPVINFRSFGENKIDVTRKSMAYMKGLQSQRIIATAKHFPGHGDTDVDSHYDLPIIRHSIERLNDVELYPFKKLIQNGLSGIMTAHIQIPSWDTTANLAATLSPIIINNVLRKQLDFKGLVFTDAMDMKGIVKHFPDGEAIIRALLAGNDIIETFTDVPLAVKSIKDAIASGRIKISDIDQKVKKILMAKSWVGLDKYKAVDLNAIPGDLNTIHSDVLNRKFAEASLTLLKNENNIIPIRDLTKSFASVSIDSDMTTDFQEMSGLYSKMDHYNIPPNSGDSLLYNILEKIKNYDYVLIGLHLSNNRAAAQYSLTSSNLKALNSLIQTVKNPIVCIFGNPYTLGKIPEIEKFQTLLIAYQNSKYIEEAAAMAIFGGISVSGKLPVTVTEHFKASSGIPSASLDRLTYGVPEMVGMDSKILNTLIDSVVHSGLIAQAYPGAVVQVAKDGRVIFRKAYGFHTYEDANYAGEHLTMSEQIKNLKSDVMDQPLEPLQSVPNNKILKEEIYGQVKLDDIYDLASVTKVSAGVLALLQLTSAGKFNLDESFNKYVESKNDSNKSNLIFRDMLTHRSGLKAWIPFWKNAIDTTATITKALELHPEMENSFVFLIKKPGFFKRIFGVKTKRVLDIRASFEQNQLLWSKCLTPQTITWKNKTFRNEYSDDYPHRISDSVWMYKNYKEKVFEEIAESPVNPGQGYVYSDLHYYYYPEMIRSLTGESWEQYLNKTYHKLGANTLVYNPLRFFSKDRIVPTEYDSLFRKELLHGTVHDEGTAMTYGVSGHAGLFGNANDLSKLMQLYLQKGSYGGERFFNADVIDDFTRYQFASEGNRRGIIFDKPALDQKTINSPKVASAESYGHSGYTGTYVWVDPVYNLSYVFLSNRVYPTRNNTKIIEMNIRQEIGNAIYKSMFKIP